MPRRTPSLRLRSGGQMPQLGFGTWGVPRDAVDGAIRAAIAAGYRMLDLSPIYGNEREVGRTLRALEAEGVVKRSELFLTSKVPPTVACSRDGTLKELNSTLHALRTSYVDLYLVHWPFCIAPDPPSWPPPMKYQLGYSAAQLRATWAAMEHAVHLGKARAIGLSNIGPNRLDILLRGGVEIIPAAVETELHPYLPEEALRALCAAHRIHVIAYSSLGARSRPKKYVGRDDPVLLTEPPITAAAAQLHTTPASVALAWALSKGVAVIPKSTNAQRIRENFAAATVRLSAEQAQYPLCAREPLAPRVPRGSCRPHRHTPAPALFPCVRCTPSTLSVRRRIVSSRQGSAPSDGARGRHSAISSTTLHVARRPLPCCR